MTVKTAAELVAAAKSEIENLDAERFAKEVDAGQAVVVDLREPAELSETGRIPGAVHIPRWDVGVPGRHHVAVSR